MMIMTFTNAPDNTCGHYFFRISFAFLEKLLDVQKKGMFHQQTSELVKQKEKSQFPLTLEVPSTSSMVLFKFGKWKQQQG